LIEIIRSGSFRAGLPAECNYGVQILSNRNVINV
jgi:hypothetical protein